MKILCVIDSLGSGGAQRQMVELSKAFKENGHEVSFLTYHPQGFYYPVLEDEGIPVKCIIEKNYFKRILKMRSYIRAAKPDVVLSFLAASNFITELSGFPSRNWKLIVGERNANAKMLKSIKLRMYRWLHLSADYVVANSHENIKLVKKINPLLSDKKCKVIYNVLDKEKWKPSSYVIKQNDTLKIVIAASHIYRKNSIALVEALNRLTTEQREKLVVEWYGDGTEKPYFDNSYPETMAKVKQYNLENVVRFYPATSNILEKIQNADVVSLFSFSEGLPNIVCEGMSCGKPILASNVSDIPRLIQNPNLYFDPGNIDSIVSSMAYLLQMDQQELQEEGQRNRKFALENFNKDTIVPAYLNLMKS